MVPTAAPAATLIVFRERDGAAPELLIAERARSLAFAPGALVFPGGRLDRGDHALAAELAAGATVDLDDAAARIAAIRETIEEAGIAIGLQPLPDAEALARLRAGLHAGDGFGHLLAGEALLPDLDALVPFARWRPDHAVARVFDARFYLARLPEGAPEPSADATENARVFWMSAADVLAACDTGSAHAIFPTRRNLERLARFHSFAEAAADARAHPVRTITPWQEDRGGVPHLVIPDDLGYPVTAVPLESTGRG